MLVLVPVLVLVLVLVVVLVVVLVLVLLIRGRTILHRGTLAILRLLLRIPCLSTNIAASQSDGSCAASQEPMEVKRHLKDTSSRDQLL